MSASSTWPDNGIHTRTRKADTLILILGDQLDPSYLRTLEASKDEHVVLMMELENESEHAPSHVQRTVLFLSAMRHAALDLASDGWDVHYTALDDRGNTQNFKDKLTRMIERFGAREVRVIRPGEWRVQQEIEDACDDSGVELRVDEDPHFLCSIDEFCEWAEGRKQLVMEFFYRKMRKDLGILIDENGNPESGQWNFDKDNRASFRDRPRPPEPVEYSADEITRGVIDLVTKRMDLPGKIESFNFPVTRRQALAALRRFLDDRIEKFGPYQDAMWTGEHFLYHSMISTSLNLKLINPREVVERTLEAHRENNLPLNSVEGFIRQIIGWREFIRGVYYFEGPDYPERNELGHDGALPEFYWDAETNMACMKHALRSVVGHAYGHHIARLMVTGNFALISGIDPQKVHAWYLGMYADAVEWATAPNTIGMALHADGGVVGTKPYCSSGNYINKMSNYCKDCGYNRSKRSGDDACPFNVFYWDFLNRHKKRFSKNNRMSLILKNLDRIDNDEMQQITVSAKTMRKKFGIS
ncbi:MAG: cryptochrome/photolyase family protein [Phycisphaerales bacterium]